MNAALWATSGYRFDLFGITPSSQGMEPARNSVRISPAIADSFSRLRIYT